MKAYLPKKFEVSIGGFAGPSYRVMKSDSGLIYTAFQTRNEFQDDMRICPSREQWLLFWDQVDKIDIWNWKLRYENRNTLDGTSWLVHIEKEDKVANSSGSNAFPDNDLFDEFLAAIRRLLGGPNFV